MARKPTLLWLALGVGAAYLFLSRKAAAVAPAAVPMPLPPGAAAPVVSIPPAVTAAQVQAGTGFWDTLTDASAANPGSGYVIFPTGSMAAFTFLPLATDASGQWYTQWSGQVWKVSPFANVDGNYNASGPVSS
jgi:hypothetical protein